jgi:hypothetical protein
VALSAVEALIVAAALTVCVVAATARQPTSEATETPAKSLSASRRDKIRLTGKSSLSIMYSPKENLVRMASLFTIFTISQAYLKRV